MNAQPDKENRRIFITEKKQPTAFISHTGADKIRFVRPFAAALLGLGIDAQVDEWEFNAGDCWTEKIYSMIGQADAVVVVLSKNSINAEWVREEINAASVQKVKRGMGLLPVILDGLKSDGIPQALHHIHWVRVNADDSAGAADQINRAMRGLRNPRKPPLGFASGQEFAMPESPPPALSLAALRQMAAGDAMAQFHLGVMYHKGEGVPQDDAETAKWFRRAAEQGLAVAQFNFGVAYHKGMGVPQDDAEAVRWFRRAAEQGLAQAQCGLGSMCLEGKGVPQDHAEAMKWFRRAAERGYAQAQFNLGVGCRDGEGVPQDDAEAAKWFRRAAEQGYARAQCGLGSMCLEGQGVPQDDAEAVKWFRRAAEQGFAEAQFNLGSMCLQGKGVLRDNAEVVKWFRRAAEQGLAEAQFNLGVAYHNGEGVPQNPRETFIWLSLAATNGQEKAAEARDEIAKRLPPADLPSAQAEAARRHAEIRRKQGE